MIWEFFVVNNINYKDFISMKTIHRGSAAWSPLVQAEFTTGAAYHSPLVEAHSNHRQQHYPHHQHNQYQHHYRHNSLVINIQWCFRYRDHMAKMISR